MEKKLSILKHGSLQGHQIFTTLTKEFASLLRFQIESLLIVKPPECVCFTIDDYLAKNLRFPAEPRTLDGENGRIFEDFVVCM